MMPKQIMCCICGKPIELGDSVYPGMNECWHRWCGSGTNGAVMTEKGLIWHKNGKKVSK